MPFMSETIMVHRNGRMPRSNPFSKYPLLFLCLIQDSGFPCFKGGPRTIQNLRKRFHLNLTEEVYVLLSILYFVFFFCCSFFFFFNISAKVLTIALDDFKQQCVSLVLSLISSSLDAWRTRQYDYYQRVLNGIL